MTSVLGNAYVALTGATNQGKILSPCHPKSGRSSTPWARSSSTSTGVPREQAMASRRRFAKAAFREVGGFNPTNSDFWPISATVTIV